MNISEALATILKEIKKGNSAHGAQSKDDLQRLIFVALAEIYSEIESMKVQLQILDEEMSEAKAKKADKKWKDRE